MNTKPDFGFQDLSSFRTKTKPEKTSIEAIELAAVDCAGENLGFTARNEAISRRRKRGITKPVEQFNIRAHIEDINRFVAHAEHTNKSYRQIFSDLVEKLPKST